MTIGPKTRDVGGQLKNQLLFSLFFLKNVSCIFKRKLRKFLTELARTPFRISESRDTGAGNYPLAEVIRMSKRAEKKRQIL